ncbi:MAG TPA: trypsin-like peptidase domain-containing protein [Bacteroidota bacterium]|nr:trypsin-like peptidase domain-containing protein [Bacteroidota bacterium]
MNNPYVRFLIILLIPLILGFGIGYSVKSNSGESATVADKDFAEAFPTTTAKTSAQQRDPQAIGSGRQNAITQAVATVSPAVVGINVIEVRTYRDPWGQMFPDDPFWRQFFGDRQQKVQSLGSGFIISSDGYIVTNDHVAGNATQITITMVGGKNLKAQLVGTDPVTDVSLLKVDATNLPFVNLGNSDDIVIGEWAIAFGNPFGLFEVNDKPTVTVGVISSTGMTLGRLNTHFYKDMIETDAAINGGNSGGPLVNSKGEVVGMNTLIYTGGQSSTFVGYGFAIPINKIKKVVADIRKKGKVVRDIWKGFDTQEVDARIARYFGLSKVTGIIVSEVEEGGPAARAGLKVADIILSVNGQTMSSTDDLTEILIDASVGDVLNLQVYRDRKTIEIKLKLERRSQSE